tara:strand:- start:65 stop:709 length:645 start_codon:yes stop_codon:yes gene_type:complete
MGDKVILAIETSTKICGSALIKGDSCIALKEECVPRKHAELLPSFVNSVLSNADIKQNMIDAVAVSIGPGSFTGLRIGLGFAKGFAYANKVPILPVPSFEAMAFYFGHTNPIHGLFFSHGENAFYQKFSWNDQIPISLLKPKMINMNDSRHYINKKGNLFHWMCEKWIPDELKIFKATPSAKEIGILGSKRYNDLIVNTPFTLEPNYIAPFKIK